MVRNTDGKRGENKYLNIILYLRRLCAPCGKKNKSVGMVYQFGQMVVNIVSRADVINERD